MLLDVSDEPMAFECHTLKDILTFTVIYAHHLELGPQVSSF